MAAVQAWRDYGAAPIVEAAGRLFDMRPSFTGNDVACCFAMNPVRLSNSRYRFAACLPTPHFAHVVFRQLRIRMGASCVATSLRRAPLAMSIGNVCGVCAEKQMRRIHTGGIVAVMKYVQGIRDKAVGKFPSDAMSRQRAFSNANHPVAIWSNESLPEPTRTKFRAMRWNLSVLVDLEPESLRILRGILVVHRDLLNRSGAMPRSVSALPGFSYASIPLNQRNRSCLSGVV